MLKNKRPHGITVKYAASIRQMKSFPGKAMQPISAKCVPV